MPRLLQRTSLTLRLAAAKTALRALACLLFVAACSPILTLAQQAAPEKSQVRFSISFGSALSSTPLDGRAYAIISTTDDPEPRFQIREDEIHSQQIFGVDVDALAPGQPAVISEDALGYPTASFRDLPAGATGSKAS